MTERIENVPTANGTLPHTAEAVSSLRAFLEKYDSSQASELPFKRDVTTLFPNEVPEQVEEMNQNGLVIAACVLKQMMELKEITWENVDEALEKNPVLKLNEAQDRTRREFLNKDGATSVLCRDGDVAIETVQEVRSWFVRLLRSKRIITELQLDADLIRNVVRVASSCINSLSERADSERDILETKVFSLGVMRFPDYRNLYITLYHLEVTAFVDSRRMMFDDVDFHGLSVVFRSKMYQMEKDVINALEPATVDTASTAALGFYQTLNNPQPSGYRVESGGPNIITAGGVLPKLAQVFAQSRDAFDQYDLVSATTTPMKCDMAIDFGDTDPESVKMLQEDTLISLASVHRMIKMSSGLNFEEVEEIFNQSYLLYKSGDVDTRYDRIHKDGHNYACYEDGKPVESLVKEIQTWIHGLIYDDDVKEQFNIEPELLVKVLEATCRHHDYLGELTETQEYFKRDLIDVAFLRLPDCNREYFQLSRFKISAFADCRRSEFDKSIIKYYKMLAKKKKEQEENERKEKEKEDEHAIDSEGGIDDTQTGSTDKSLESVSQDDTEAADNGSDEKQHSDGSADKDMDEEGDADEEIKSEELDTCGLTGEFQSTKYIAKLENTRMLSDKVRNIAIRQGYAVFGIVKE